MAGESVSLIIGERDGAKLGGHAADGGAVGEIGVAPVEEDISRGVARGDAGQALERVVAVLLRSAARVDRARWQGARVVVEGNRACRELDASQLRRRIVVAVRFAFGGE